MCQITFVRSYMAMSAEKEERQAILRVFKETQEEKRVTEVMTNLKHFGEWVKWDAVQQLDRKWHSLLAYECDSQLQFLLNATEDTLPTPSNLCRCGGRPTLSALSAATVLAPSGIS